MTLRVISILNKEADCMKTDLPMAPIAHIEKRVAKRARISLSSFFSNVLLLEGTFIEFIITCDSFPTGVNSKHDKITSSDFQIKYTGNRMIPILLSHAQ